MRAAQVASGVYRVPLAWSNAYVLVGGGEATILDTGLRQDREALLAALAEIGVANDRLRAVLLTHGHCDHAGNAQFLAHGLYGLEARDRPNNRADAGAVHKAGEAGEKIRDRARLYVHRDEARFLEWPRRGYAGRMLRTRLRLLAALLFTAGERLHPVARGPVDVRLTDGEVIAVPGGPLRVVACPGHTPGHVAYFRERDGLLFSGDAIMNIIPVRRVTGLSLPLRVFTDDWTLTRRSARHLADLRPAQLLAGHGGPLAENCAARLSAWARTLK